MPLYEYACPACHQRFEQLTPHAQADRVRCTACGQPATRQLSAFGVKGGGQAASSAAAPAMAGRSGGHACGAGCRH